VKAWREIFAELKLINPAATRRINPDAGGVMASVWIGNHTTPAKALEQAGFPVPDTDPHEPWLFLWSGGNRETPLRLGKIEVVSKSGRAEVFTQSMTQGTNLVATRCRMAVLMGRVRGDATVPAVLTYADVESAHVDKRTLTITTRSGFRLSVSFDVKIKSALPLMPQWITAITVIGADSPSEAKHIADMDRAVRQRRKSAESEIEEVVALFVDAITNISGAPSS